jgi:tetratricopeptide (TPR) repeat protein
VSPAALIESLIQSGLAALSAGAADAGLDNLRRAGAEAERNGDRILQARALCELGTALIHTVRGYDDEGAIHLRQAAEIARETGEAPTLCRALQEMGYAEALAGRRPSAQRLLNEALEVCTDDGERAGAHGLIGFNLADWGRHEDGLAHYDRALGYAREAGNRRREVWSLGLGGWGQMLAGNHQRAEEWLSEALRLTDDLRWIAFRPWPAAVLAETRLMGEDRPAQVRASLEETFALSCQLGDPCWEAAAARVIALTHEAEGDLDTAAGWLATASERCLRVTDTYAALNVAITADRMRFAGKRGDGAARDRAARDLLALAARTHADGYLATAMAALSSR